MATRHKLPPSAASLSESMRDLGYSLATAIADIVDNSITAEATEINVYCDLAPDDPVLAIVDNGVGMSKDQLFQAMKHGSINPKKQREPMDLGRFGLGLKTSSFSQCRLLSVVSSKNSKRVGAKWDLDLVEKADDWIISILDENEIEQQLPKDLPLPKTGTAVVWRNLDRLFENQSGSRRDEIVTEKLDLVEKHLALVFHRFLAGEIKNRKALTLMVNRHQVKPFDPFCRKNKATQVFPEEIVRVDGIEVKIQPYVLPHHSHLSSAEYDYYQSRSNFLSNQGAYIYRNGRLMAWGGWFRLVPKSEATKLARVCIDFPNSLDEKWTIDIKKSKATPPREVRERVKQIIEKIAEGSARIHRGRGKKLFEESNAPIWERYANKGGVHYDLNAEHPLLSVLEQSLSENQRYKFDAYVKSVVSSLPIERIYSDYSENPHEVSQSEKDRNQALKRLRQLKVVVSSAGTVNPVTFREIVDSTRLFTNFEDIVDHFIREEFNEH